MPCIYNAADFTKILTTYLVEICQITFDAFHFNVTLFRSFDQVILDLIEIITLFTQQFPYPTLCLGYHCIQL